jgi:hypothetical protein
MHISTIYVFVKFREKPIYFVIYVKIKKIYLLKSLIFDFPCNDFVSTLHVKMYVRIFHFIIFKISK